MRVEPNNTVLLAEEYDRLRDWYRAALDLDLDLEWTDGYRYAELAKHGQVIVGIADAAEMGVAPRKPRASATILQLRTDDIEALFERVREHGGEPTDVFHGRKEGFRFGSFTDPEGNEVWVVETLRS